MGKVLCIGHSAYDITLQVDEYPVENQKVRVGSTISCKGGAASNAASLLAKWGMDTYFVGAVGDDYYGDKCKKEFLEDGISIDYLETTKKFNTTSSYIIANRSNGSRTIVISRTKNEEAEVKEIPRNVQAIMADGEEPSLSIKAILENPQAISVLDAGNLKPAIVEIGKYVKYFVCSKDFAEEFTKMKIDVNDINTIIKCYECLVDYFKTNVIITLEATGSFTKTDDYLLVPSIKVVAVDSTGAGDIYHGAITYFLMNNYKVEDAMKYANITGALSTTKVGGRFSIPTLEEVLNYDKLS